MAAIVIALKSRDCHLAAIDASATVWTTLDPARPEQETHGNAQRQLHARPAVCSSKQQAGTGLTGDRQPGGGPVDATSILGVMALGAKFGEEVVLTADGNGADEPSSLPPRATSTRSNRHVESPSEGHRSAWNARASGPGRATSPPPSTSPQGGTRRWRSRNAALETVAADVEGKRRLADDTGQQILKATALIARDKGLVKAADKTSMAAAAPRHRERGRGVRRQVRGARRYFAERVVDLGDVGEGGRRHPGRPPRHPEVHGAECRRRRGPRSGE